MIEVSKEKFFEVINDLNVNLFVSRTRPDTVTEFTLNNRMIGKSITDYSEDPCGIKTWFLIKEYIK